MDVEGVRILLHVWSARFVKGASAVGVRNVTGGSEGVFIAEVKNTALVSGCVICLA